MSAVYTTSPRCAADAITTASVTLAPGVVTSASPAIRAKSYVSGSTVTPFNRRETGPRWPRHHSTTTTDGTVTRCLSTSARRQISRILSERRSMAMRAPVSSVIPATRAPQNQAALALALAAPQTARRRFPGAQAFAARCLHRAGPRSCGLAGRQTRSPYRYPTAVGAVPQVWMRLAQPPSRHGTTKCCKCATPLLVGFGLSFCIRGVTPFCAGTEDPRVPRHDSLSGHWNSRREEGISSRALSSIFGMGGVYRPSTAM